MVIVILELENLTELLYATELESHLYCQHNPESNPKMGKRKKNKNLIGREYNYTSKSMIYGAIQQATVLTGQQEFDFIFYNWQLQQNRKTLT